MPHLIRSLSLLLLPSLALAGGSNGDAFDNMGAWSYRVPIDVPPGPGQATPELALVYSSAAGNGIAGIGWDVPYSSVRLDLKDGVPTWSQPSGGYDCRPSEWEGRVWLDGMETVPWSKDPLGRGACVFRTRPDTFALMLPIFDGGGGCGDAAGAVSDQPTGWAVVRPDGTTWWYGDGGEDEPCQTTYREISWGHDLGLGMAPATTTKWLLHHVEDRSGNLVTFHPDRADRPHWTEVEDSPSTGTEGCSGCLRAVTWAAYDRDGPEDQGYAWSPTPVGDPVEEWQFPPHVGGGLSGQFSQFLADPAALFPRAVTHHYFARFDYEDRADVRVSHLSGVETATDRRLRQISVGQRGDVARADGAVTFSGSAEAIRSYVLHYRYGTTGRSRLVRVHPVPGQWRSDGAYTGIPQDGYGDWDPAAADLAGTLPNPWEFVWTDNGLQEPGNAFVTDGTGENHDIEDQEVPWLGSNYHEGGFPTRILKDWTGDGLPDLIQHSNLLPDYSDEIVAMPDTFNVYMDSRSSITARDQLWVLANTGDGFAEAAAGPTDPFALQAVGDYMARFAVPDGSGGFDLGLPEDIKPGYGLGGLCEMWGLGAGSLSSFMTPLSPGPFIPVGTSNDQMAWCEHRSCAPYCEAGTSISGTTNLPPPSLNNEHTSIIPASIDIDQVWGVGIEDWVDIELLEIATDDASGIHSKDDLVLWRRYGVVRSTTGNAQATASDTLPGIDPILGGLEPRTITRWVDGYSQLSFETRVRSTLGELWRQGDWEDPMAEAPDEGVLVQTGLVHDTLDINGDGCLDRVLGGAGILENNLLGEAAIQNRDPDAPKDFVASTAHMSWMVALCDPETREFRPIQPWTFDRTHPWLMGGPTEFPDPTLDWDENDPRLFAADHGLEFLSIHEANAESAPAPVTASASVSGGLSGPSAGASLSVGPVSFSLGLTASGASPSIGIGPVSISPSGLSVGFLSMPWSANSVGADWVAIMIAIVEKGLEAFQLPYGPPIAVTDGGAQVTLGGFFGDSTAPEPSMRWERQGLHDMNGDGRPDLVIADQPGWDESGLDLDWVVLLNNGDGFDDPIPWPGVPTNYLSADLTAGYVNEAGVAAPPQLTMRRGHQVAGLTDMNGDGLPDFVYSACDVAPDYHEPPPRAFDWFDGLAFQWAHETPDLQDCVDGGELGMFVRMNNGHGFEPESIDWLRDGNELEFGLVEGHFPALSSTRTHIQQSPLYADGWSVGIHGLADWNGDGLPDLWTMAPNSRQEVTQGWEEDRNLVVYLNDGTKFVSDDNVSGTQRYGRLEIELPERMGNYGLVPPLGFAPLWDEANHRGYPQVRRDVNRLDGMPGGAIRQQEFADLDGDGTMEIAQSVMPENGQSMIARHSIQNQVPDLLERVVEPAGALQDLAWAPARTFLDLPYNPNPEELADGSPLTDGVEDRYPASTQVIKRVTSYDGLGDRRSPPQVATFQYADPQWDVSQRRTRGWGRVRLTRGETSIDTTWATDRQRVGLRELTEIEGAAGSPVWRSTSVKHDSWPFFDNYPRVGGELANWHYAPTEEFAVAQEPFSGSGVLESTTWTAFDSRNGGVICQEVDLLGDGFVDRATQTHFDSTLLADGKLDAVLSTSVAALPEATFTPFAPYGDCDRASWGSHTERTTNWDYALSGLPVEKRVTDNTGQSFHPLIETFQYTPDGQLVAHTTALDQHGVGSTTWTLYDPLVGVYPVEVHGEPNLVEGVGLVSSTELCGVHASCPAAAHGMPADVTSPTGLLSSVDYDAAGRAIETWDDLSLAPTVTDYTRFVRRGAVDDPDLGAIAGEPAVVHVTAPLGSPGFQEDVQAEAWTFLDGRGEAAMVRALWGDGPVYRVSGLTQADDRGRKTVAWWPCESSQTWTSGSDWADGFDPTDSSLGTCSAPPPAEAFDYDVLDRVVSRMRPDGATLSTTREVVPPMLRTSSELFDPHHGVIERVQVVSSPRLKKTVRFDAETFEHPTVSGWLGGPPSQSVSEIETREAFDALGRRIQVRRTGVPHGDETVFSYDGLDRLIGYADADQGQWTFEYDDRGRLRNRLLWDPANGSIERETLWEYDDAGRVQVEEHFATDPYFVLQPTERWSWTYDEDLAALDNHFPSPAGGHAGRATGAVHTIYDGSGDYEDVGQAWRFDPRGRLVEESQWVGGPAWSGSAIPESLVAQYGWSEGGERTWVRMPHSVNASVAEEVSMTLDAGGRPDALGGVGPFGSALYVSSSRYEVQGRPTLLELGTWNADSTSPFQAFEYEPGNTSTQALSRVVVGDGGGTPWLDRSYEWDAAGNLRLWSDAATAGSQAETWGCRYDGLSALQACKTKGSGDLAEEIEWRYDPLGNLIWESASLASGARQQAFYPRAAHTLPGMPNGYQPLNAPLARVDGGGGADLRGYSLSYDARGHLALQVAHPPTSQWNGAVEVSLGGLARPSGGFVPADAFRRFDWSGAGRLASVSVMQGAGVFEEVSRFTWDASGARAAHQELGGGGVNVRRFGGLLEFTEREGEVEATAFYWLGSRRVAQRDFEVDGDHAEPAGDSALRFVTGDHLGSASLIFEDASTSGTGFAEFRRRVDYEPFGRIRKDGGPEAQMAEHDAPSVEQLFNGKQRLVGAFGLSGDLGLEGYDYGARFYLPELSRWMSADAVTPEIVWEANGFAYVRQNPLRYVDPDGRASTDQQLAVQLENPSMQHNTSLPSHLGPIGRVLLEMLPVVGELADGVRSLIGRDPWTRQGVPDGERAVAGGMLAASVGPGLLLRRFDGAVSIWKALDELPVSQSDEALLLNKSLASRQQLDELAGPDLTVIAGPGSTRKLNDAPRLEAEYGGETAEWQKVTSSNYEAADGSKMETHAYRNDRSGQVVEPKTILEPAKLE